MSVEPDAAHIFAFGVVVFIDYHYRPDVSHEADFITGDEFSDYCCEHITPK